MTVNTETTPMPASLPLKVIDQDSKEGAREAIHIKINNLACNDNTGKGTSKKSLTAFQEQIGHLMGLSR